MVKKSLSTDRYGVALVVALRWALRLTFINWVFAAVGVALLSLAFWDPQRPAREARRWSVLREERARDNARMDREAKVVSTSGVVDLSFRHLSFRLPPEAHRTHGSQIGYGQWLPAGIKGYDGREIRIRGYMVPTKLERGKVRECLVLANQLSCCFGQTPRFCDFIIARATKEPFINQSDRPVTFQGTLQVRDVFENGYWTALYTMDSVSAER